MRFLKSVKNQSFRLSPLKHMPSGDTPLCKCSMETVYQHHREGNHGNCCQSTGAPDFLTDSCALLFPPDKHGMPLAHCAIPPRLSRPLLPPFLLSPFPLIIKSFAQRGFTNLQHLGHAEFPAKTALKCSLQKQVPIVFTFLPSSLLIMT